MHERLKKIRKSLHLTQQEFADKLGITRSTVATYETGKSNPSDAAVSLMCKEFNINETWLRTGEGDMFIEQTADEQIATFIGDLLKDEEDSFKRRLISGLCALDDDGWDVLQKFLDSIHQKKS